MRRHKMIGAAADGPRLFNRFWREIIVNVPTVWLSNYGDVPHLL
jgi:hypothetical protein